MATKTKKKAAKKVVKKKSSPKKAPTQELVIRVEQAPTAQSLAMPISEGNKYMLPKNWMSEKQVLRILSKTPAEHVYNRPGKGGQVFQYVTGGYVEKVLNYTFGWNWDFEVTQHGKEGDQVWVLGKLTVKDDHGHTITKTQFGRADIKFKKDTKIMLDFGNDLKAATTDALKKCASLLGIASDIYSKSEYKHETGKDVQEENYNQDVQGKGIKTIQIDDDTPKHVCAKCDGPVTEQEAAYSKRMFGKVLCREHQAKAKAMLAAKKGKK